jgi:hypothetical protein
VEVKVEEIDESRSRRRVKMSARVVDKEGKVYCKSSSVFSQVDWGDRAFIRYTLPKQNYPLLTQ